MSSRPARNNRDWHQLLELCSVFGVLIADGERLYDPRAYHDRLLLGLSGIMSEAELHQIRMRLHQGERQKAARGELRLPLPALGRCERRERRSGEPRDRRPVPDAIGQLNGSLYTHGRPSGWRRSTRCSAICPT